MFFLIKCFEIVLRPFLQQNSGQMTYVCIGVIIHSAAQALLPKLTQAAPLAGTGFGFPINCLKIGKWGLSGILGRDFFTLFTAILLVSTHRGTSLAKMHATCVWSLCGISARSPIVRGKVVRLNLTNQTFSYGPFLA